MVFKITGAIALILLGLPLIGVGAIPPIITGILLIIAGAALAIGV